MNSNRIFFRAFNEISCGDFSDHLKKQLKGEIDKMTKEYILGVDEEKCIEYLVDRFILEPLVVDFNSESVDTPIVRKELVDGRFRDKYEREVYRFTIRYNYTGTDILFRVRPSSWHMTSNDISISDSNKSVSFTFDLYDKDSELFTRTKNECKSRSFANMDGTNIFANEWTKSLPKIVASYFREKKKHYILENDFFAAVNVKVDEKTNSVFSAPTIKRKIVPQPTVSKTFEFSSNPTMSIEMYNDILKVIYDFGKSMERKPSIYKGKDEEGLRDQFLLVLETRYDGTTATGETFNRGGRTDIILKYANDGSNLFVAECKIWHGASEFHNAIYQLFDRYLTWRDSKVALMLFVTNKDFSNVLHTIQNEVKSNQYFVKEAGARGDSSFSYFFHLPQDINKIVQLEVLAFHFDKIED